ncbi:unnamed protein product [Candida verbasci]|uniref:Uncharacterized protein n=1 Tax=Candida verbasci TaxID=1227364 RepID=A0A9W4TUW1_9ASCO|nr:unnamed protein product [Candida verbasci]
MVVGESRSELLKWLNSTLDLNYSKIEQCGTGAAFVQLMDSIYYNDNIELKKVKFQPKNEYEYRHNWKILQSIFIKYNITKNIEVEKLIKCRLQDNLELLQWFKRYWMENKDYNIVYDAKLRRQGMNGISSSTNPSPNNTINQNQLTPSTSVNKMSPMNKPYQSPYAQKPRQKPSMTNLKSTTNTSTRVSSNPLPKSRSRVTTPTNNTPTTVQTQRRISSNENHQQPTRNLHSNIHSGSLDNSTPISLMTTNTKEYQELNDKYQFLEKELEEFKINCNSLQTERNFYFNKLRDIEILVQHILELNDQDKMDQLQGLDLVQYSKQIQEILYSTEEGFGDNIHSEVNYLNENNENINTDQFQMANNDLDILDNESF